MRQRKKKIIYICNNFYRNEYGTVCSVMTVPITVLRVVPIQRYHQGNILGAVIGYENLPWLYKET